MRLTRAQMYLLKTLVPIDAKNEINYVDSSKLLAEIIKKFYIHSSKKADRWSSRASDIVCDL